MALASPAAVNCLTGVMTMAKPLIIVPTVEPDSLRKAKRLYADILKLDLIALLAIPDEELDRLSRQLLHYKAKSTRAVNEKSYTDQRLAKAVEQCQQLSQEIKAKKAELLAAKADHSVKCATWFGPDQWCTCYGK